MELPKVEDRHRLTQQFRAFSRGGDVVRWHTRPFLQPPNVAAHTYTVVWLLYLLADEAPSCRLLMHGMAHDVPEFITGDMPGNVKAELGGFDGLEAEVLDEARIELPTLSEHEKRLLKLADCLAGMKECARERQLGNQLLETCYERYHKLALGLARAPREYFICTYITNQWEKANAT